MDPSAAIATGLVLGLSSGGYCFWSCASVMAPFLVSTDASPQDRRWSSVSGALRALGWYNLGRLLAYLAAGIGASWIASAESIAPQVQATAMLATAALLAHAVVRPSGQPRCWHTRGRRSAGAFAIGVLQGLSPCPPFLAAVGITLTSPALLGGLLLFLSLFVGTALFTLPLAFVEPLRRRAWLFWTMRGVGVLVCVVLVVRAGFLLWG